MIFDYAFSSGHHCVLRQSLIQTVGIDVQQLTNYWHDVPVGNLAFVGIMRILDLLESDVAEVKYSGENGQDEIDILKLKKRNCVEREH